jgi:hypothetical protein
MFCSTFNLSIHISFLPLLSSLSHSQRQLMLTRRGIELPSESMNPSGGGVGVAESPRKALKCKRIAEDKAASARWNEVFANSKKEKKASIAWAFQVQPDRLDTAGDRPSTGVRRIPGRSGEDCKTFYKDNPSIKTFPEQKNRSYLSNVSSNSTAVSPRTGFVAAPHTPREVTGKVSCEGSVGSPHPPFLSIRKMHIRRPEITALDSYDIPVYSCFSRDRAFHPVLDDAMKKYRERRAHQADQVREKLRKAAAYHTTVVVKQFAEAEEDYRRLVETSQPFVSIPRSEAEPVTQLDRRYDPHEELKAKQAAQGTVIPLPPSLPISVATPGRDQRGSVAGPSPSAARRDTISPLSNRSESVEGTAAPPPPLPVTEDKQTITPKPPVAPSPKRRPHTAGPSRVLQHTVIERNGLDAPSELVNLVRPASASTPAQNQQAAPATPQLKMRPHSAKPIASVNMAVDCGGILGSQPLIQLLSTPHSARSSAPRSHLTDSIDSRMKQFRRMSAEGDDGLTDTPSTF